MEEFQFTRDALKQYEEKVWQTVKARAKEIANDT